MGFTSVFVPMSLQCECRSSDVSLAARISSFLFGAPNARRANGIVSTAFDVAGWVGVVASKILGRSKAVPVFAIDRMGTEFHERLPRIWLSEKVSNTRRDGSRRVFVESYPSSPDRGGLVALELGDRYLGEGMKASEAGSPEATECFKAAEILYLHSVRRGNREAASRLRRIYVEDLCEGEYWTPWLEARAKHARKGTPWRFGSCASLRQQTGGRLPGCVRIL